MYSVFSFQEVRVLRGEEDFSVHQVRESDESEEGRRNPWKMEAL